MEYGDVIIIGAGLAGLTCGLEVACAGRTPLVLEGRHVVGGRTSSWVEDGMPVESGLHRVLGFYTAFPRVLQKAGIDVNQIVHWEDEVEIRLPDGQGSGVFGAAPLYRPYETIRGALGNFDVLPLFDRVPFLAFLTAGLFQYFTNPDSLDQVSVAHMARSFGVTERVIHNVLVPLTSGLYFLPPDNYSAYVFFGTFGAFLPTIYNVRVGAFFGGMTEVMAAPMAGAIVRRGGEVRTMTPVSRVLIENGRAVGVEAGSRTIMASHVVIATSLTSAQSIIRTSLGAHPWFQPMLQLPSMPSVSIQIETDCPSMPLDRTTFGPGTSLASFAEQSRTTFHCMPGRLSIILTPPEKFLHMADDHIFEIASRDAERLGVPVRDRTKRYRVVRLYSDFYSLSPGTDALRPSQTTPVPGLSLAGDYTRQQYLATMEGAVVSGELAARAVQAAASDHDTRAAR